ncbi:sensor domain-containing protein [Streptomyces tubbatahanensis]|uniref:Sensor domain-containing protein n=1 Tax=Streptomyces tubbatahanensis TaxID=2923272 RepID=A0ABY3XTB1_9ACTN|nr:sensor domain-containing protein [Streptomyces tubbatahanensis]UNS97637.1 sensor domain-containing protein [Streptomyces tubbatahanensis]
MTTTTHAQMRTPVSALPADRGGRGGRFGREVGYLLSGLPLGIASFILMITGFALGVSTLILFVGVPVLAGTLAMARYLARVEADHIATVTGRPLPARAVAPGPGPGRAGRWSGVRDPQAWRDLVHAVIAFPARVVTFCLTLAWLAGGVGGVTYGLWSWPIPRDDSDGWVNLAFGMSGRVPDIVGNLVLGVFLLATTVPVVRGLATAQASLGRVLLRRGDV